MSPIDVSYSVNIWSCLESSRGLNAIAACWRERLGDQFEPFKTVFLQRAHGVAKGMPCPRGCACTHEIVTSGVVGRASPRAAEYRETGELSTAREDARPTVGKIDTAGDRLLPHIRAVCRCEPPNCPDIALTPEDIVLYELSWNKIARALCHVFALDHKPADLGLLNTRQLGSWSVDAVPVILTLQHDRGWFRSVLLELIARLRQRFILLAPTAKNLDAVGIELLESANAGFFALDSCLALNEDGALRLSASRAPGELFAGFTPQPAAADEELATRAFALVRQLESEKARKAPSPLTVFRMYCIDGLGMSAIARKCNCTRTTVHDRLKLIEARTRMNAAQLRKISAHLEKAEATAADSRASHIHRRNLIYDDDQGRED